MVLRRAASFVRDLVRQRRRHTTLPRYLTYIVTYTCNARCIMCDSWKMTSDGDLTPEQVEAIFRQLPRMDMVRLSGGEPFARRDLPELAALAVRHLRPMMLHVTTNGFLTRDIVRFCEERDRRVPLQLLVSVDGVGDIHNRIRGRETAWRNVTRTLEALAPRQRELRLRLGVNQTVVDAEGASHYRKLHEFLRPLRVRHNLVLAYDQSATYSVDERRGIASSQIGEFTTFADFGPEQVERLVEEVEADLAELPLAERLARRYYLRGVRHRLLAGASRPNPPCVALTSHLRLMPDGSVPTCQFNGTVVGNLARQPFAEVWRAATTEVQRDWVRACSGCWAECEVLPSAVYTGDLLRAALPGRRPRRRPDAARPRLPVVDPGGPSS